SMWRDLFEEDGFGSAGVAADAGVAPDGLVLQHLTIVYTCDTCQLFYIHLCMQSLLQLLWHIVIGSKGVGEGCWWTHLVGHDDCVMSKVCDEHRDFALRVNTLVGQMNEACSDRISFVQELESVAGETVPTKTMLFLEKMMDKEGNREWQLRALKKEAREMAFDIELFLLKLMDEEPSHMRVFGGDDGQRGRPLITDLHCNADSSDWTDVLSYFCQKAAAEDRRFTTNLNTLREEMENVCEKRRNLAYELRSDKGIIVAGKAAEFVTDTLRKDNGEMAQLHWEVMFILRCRDEIAEDLRLAREINALCARLTAVIYERENFKDELDVLAGRRVPVKMSKFMGGGSGQRHSELDEAAYT
nr:hypothetical protein [Tanacetum cinerariifolium]